MASGTGYLRKLCTLLNPSLICCSQLVVRLQHLLAAGKRSRAGWEPLSQSFIPQWPKDIQERCFTGKKRMDLVWHFFCYPQFSELSCHHLCLFLQIRSWCNFIELGHLVPRHPAPLIPQGDPKKYLQLLQTLMAKIDVTLGAIKLNATVRQLAQKHNRQVVNKVWQKL